MNREHLNPLSPFAVVVNDDLTQLNVLSGLVRKAGMEPRAFAAAEAALVDMSIWTEGGVGDICVLPSIIVTDLYMPGIDGWRFCRLLRSPEYAAFNHVPILVVSATYASDEAERIAADLGAEAFLLSCGRQALHRTGAGNPERQAGTDPLAGADRRGQPVTGRPHQGDIRRPRLPG